VAGIHGGPDGAYSVAYSGGYEENVYHGDYFEYTGEGGRNLTGTKANPKNLRTTPQSRDQNLTKGKISFVRKC
jgi:E3 ubiquitin-protein ligase UHRF1/protocadherin-15